MLDNWSGRLDERNFIALKFHGSRTFECMISPNQPITTPKTALIFLFITTLTN